MTNPPALKPPDASSSGHAFRKAVLLGLGALFPPLLTVLIFVWAINTTQQYVLEPVTSGARETLVWLLADTRQELVTKPDERTATAEGRTYYRLDDGSFVPLQVFERVRKSPGSENLPQTPGAVYRRYIDLTYLRPYYAIPSILAVFVLALYLLGRFMAAGFGALFWGRFELAILRLPLVRKVYSAVKQVSDFFFSQQQIQFTRVVAVEYPRRGMWSMAFVTSEGLHDIRAATNEAVLGVFIPTSPMPMSGYALTVLKREVIDLNVTIDEALQFIVSCGLVIPPQEMLPKRQGIADGDLEIGSPAPSARQP